MPFIGRDWADELRAWDAARLARHAEVAEGLRGKGWTQPGAAEFVAYQILREEMEPIADVRPDSLRR